MMIRVLSETRKREALAERYYLQHRDQPHIRDVWQSATDSSRAERSRPVGRGRSAPSKQSRARFL